LCSLVTLTPYESWRRQHAQHHMHWNDLDNRHSGTDIYSTCLTVDEYRALKPRGRLFYRFIWHPITSFIVLPPLVFWVLYRMPFDMPRSWVRERRSVMVTNIALAVLFGTLVAVFGWRTVRWCIYRLEVAAVRAFGCFRCSIASARCGRATGDSRNA
jgi:omega-6 fatty acid desaturase (delta-12 desaturase)